MKIKFDEQNNLIVITRNGTYKKVMIIFHVLKKFLYGKLPSSKNIWDLKNKLHELLAEYSEDYKSKKNIELYSVTKENQQEFLDRIEALMVELKLTK